MKNTIKSNLHLIVERKFEASGTLKSKKKIKIRTATWRHIFFSIMNVPKALNVQERSATFAKVLEYEAFNVRYCIYKHLKKNKLKIHSVILIRTLNYNPSFMKKILNLFELFFINAFYYENPQIKQMTSKHITLLRLFWPFKVVK